MLCQFILSLSLLSRFFGYINEEYHSQYSLQVLHLQTTMFRSKSQKQEVPYVEDRPVILCQVFPTSDFASSETHILPVLAVLKRHKFEIKPVVTRGAVYYFCELRDDIQPWSSKILDQAMRDALPLDVRNDKKPPVHWSFA